MYLIIIADGIGSELGEVLRGKELSRVEKVHFKETASSIPVDLSGLEGPLVKVKSERTRYVILKEHYHYISLPEKLGSSQVFVPIPSPYHLRSEGG